MRIFYMTLKERKNPAHKLIIGATEIKQMRSFKYLGNMLTENEKCDVQNRKKHWYIE